jgi:hypothetical protein
MNKPPRDFHFSSHPEHFFCHPEHFFCHPEHFFLSSRAFFSVIPGLTRDPSLKHPGCRIKSGMTSGKVCAFAGTQIANHFVIPGLTRDP